MTDADRLQREHAEMLANLTATQTRCNVLLEETREQRRDLASLGELAEAARELGEDERLVLVAIARRLAVGRECYGALDVERDRRNWRHEAAEEALDCAVYLACETTRRRA